MKRGVLMASDFTVIRAVRARFGDSTGDLAGESDAPNVGTAEDFTFDCPRVNLNEMAVLEFESIDVTVEGNIMSVNGTALSAPLRKSTGFADTTRWTANIVLIDKGVLKPTGNVLHVEARNDAGGTTGNRDDFILDNIVVFYKTA
jgi:hypothetical protein